MSLLVILLAVSTSASAQTAPRDLSLEDLMKLDAGQVFGASERLQPVLEAPASVSFITADEIRRYGYRTLADLLRSVRGLYVTDDRNFNSLGTRGFAKPDDFNSRVLVLVNGHRVNDNITGGAQLGAEFFLDPAIFERVEIIRGPASSLYGDSAFFAVVNVITRTGVSLDGSSIALEVGTLGTQVVRAAEGHRFANGVEVALSGTFERSDGVKRLYFPAFDSPATNHGVAEGLDGESARQVYGRLDFKDLTVTAAYGHRQRDVPTASRGTVFNEQVFREETTDRHTLVDATYQHSFGGAIVTLGASFDRFTFDAVLPLAVAQGGAPALVAESAGLGTRWTVDGRVTRVFRQRHTVTAGVELIDNLHQHQSSRFLDPLVTLSDIRDSSTQQAVHIQDEIRPAHWLIVNAGLRIDSYERFTPVTPRASVIVLPSSKQSVKYLYGNAFRAPHAFELNAFLFGDRVLNLRPESIGTHEVVWERYALDWIRTSVSAYWYSANRLITAIPDAATRGAITYVNEGEVRARGLELEAQVRLPGESRMLVSYALQRAVDQATQAELSNSPRHAVKARISVPGPTHRSFVSAEGQYLSSRATLAGLRVSPAVTLDVTVVQPLSRSWELYGGVRNVLDALYADPAPSANRQDTIVQNGRTARIGLRWVRGPGGNR